MRSLILAWCFLLAAGGMLASAAAAEPADDRAPWDDAWRAGRPSADETRAWLHELGQYVFDHHLKKHDASPQRGMVYEYFDTTRRGEFDQFIQGEALDTMHDGAWLAAALVTAHRATGDPFYRDFVVQWQLPFYLKMLNHSDELFDAARNDARAGAAPWGREWALQPGEKGFVPYYWDDGGSVSLERRIDKNPLAIRPSVDHLAGQPNPRFLLDGYSLGSSNHLAQDLGVMLQVGWLLLRDSDDPAERRLAEQTALAAQHLHECRVRHHGFIAMCAAPTALANGDIELRRRLPDPRREALWKPSNHYTRAMVEFRPDQKQATPGFMDNQQYDYYAGLVATGGELPRPLAFRLIYDAFTEPLLYRSYCDDAPAPPGMNRFDLYPLAFVNGQPEHYRSDRRGPFGRPLPTGSRLGPQAMIVAGWALQLLREHPGVWEAPLAGLPADTPWARIHDPAPRFDGAAATDGAPPLTDVTLDGLTLHIGATREALIVASAQWPTERVLHFHQAPGAAGSHARLQFSRPGSLTATNDRGEKLQFDHADPPGDGFAWRVRIPFTVVKEQAAWANVIEHGWLSVAMGDEHRDVYFASPESQVRDWLDWQLAGGLRTWQAVFREQGYIPTSLRRSPDWDKLSDSGGYAHLLSAGSQYLWCLEGKADWREHRFPSPP